MPKVSVIVPVYNKEKYLPNCLESLVNQTEESIEIILINDGSTDNSLKILKFYQKLYPYKIRVISYAENQGVSYARNQGLKIAEGKYIGFADADDVVSLNMFYDYRISLEEYNGDVLVGNSFRITKNDYLNDFYINDKKLNIHEKNYEKNESSFFFETPAIWDKLWLHDLIDGVSFVNGARYEDIAFTYPLLLKAKKVLSTNREDYLYRDTPKSIMHECLEINPYLLDVFKVCLYARKLGETFNLNQKKKSLLLDTLKEEIYYHLYLISNYKISDKEKKSLLSKMIALAKYYFKDFFEYDTEFAKEILTFERDILKFYKTNNIKTEYQANILQKKILKNYCNF